MEIKRSSYIDTIFPYFDTPVIKVLTGMRRVGKSTLIVQLIRLLQDKGTDSNAILYINKELLEWDFIKSYMDLYNFIKSFYLSKHYAKRYIFIDEIQEISGWEKAIASIFSESFADITISGSNAHLLASDLATLLSGRYIEFKVYPLTFKEFCAFHQRSNSTEKEQFSLFLRYGGLPGIHAFELSDTAVFTYLHGIYSTIVLKDVIQRNEIKDPALLDHVIKYVFDNCGNITSVKRISDYLKTQKLTASVDKVLNYIHYLEKAFLVYEAQRYDIKGLRLLELYSKYYAGDIGLRHGLLGYKDGDINGLLENIVYLELLQRGYSVHIGKFDTMEVDFIAEKQNEKLYIQVCYLLPNEEVIEREFRPLKRIQDSYPKYILTLDEFQAIERNGIKTINLIDFLLAV